MNEMVTKVTYAIMRAFFNREPDENGNRVFNASPSDNTDLAIAAIEAMREPAEAMIAAGYIDPDAYYEVPPDQVWVRMIDAALAEQPLKPSVAE